MNNLTELLVTYWWWYVPALFNIYYYFVEQPKWKTFGGLLWRLLFSICPGWNIMILVARYILTIEAFYDEKSNPEYLSLFSFFRSIHIEYVKDEKIIVFKVEKGTRIISKLDLVLLYPLGCIIQSVYWLLTRKLRN